MSMFNERPDELTPELEEAYGWLRQEAAEAGAQKGLAGWRWDLLYGKRESGGAGGVPRLSQWGFQVTAVIANTDEPHPVACFIEESIALENPPLAQRILDLWTDRLST